MHKFQAWRGKVELPVCLTQYHNLKTDVEVEVHFQIFLNSVPDDPILMPRPLRPGGKPPVQ